MGFDVIDKIKQICVKQYIYIYFFQKVTKRKSIYLTIKYDSDKKFWEKKCV